MNSPERARTRRTAPRIPGLRRAHVHAALIVAGAVGLYALLGNSREAEAMRSPEPAVLSGPLAPSAAGVNPGSAPLAWRTVTIRPGDSLSAIFDDLGLGPQVLHGVLNSGPEARELQRLLPGETLSFATDSGRLQRLDYAMDPLRTLEVTSGEAGYAAALRVEAPEIRTAQATGVIESSFYEAGLRAGLSHAEILQMAEILGWEVDFALGVHPGDRFSVIHEERYAKGKRLEGGDIVAAEFVNRGRRVQAVRYTDPTGHTDYYTPDGRSLRKAFLRSPVDFHRISSRYKKERYHPVHGVRRPHRGVDFAAATGTPIKASSDGTIVSLGQQGGYGKTIIIRHDGNYSTLYAHLSRYQKGLRAGTPVRRGETIGYVGKTGIATGPHLHYEFRVNGVHRDPQQVKLPDAAPVRSEFMAAFEAHGGGLLTRLAALDPVRTAAN